MSKPRYPTNPDAPKFTPQVWIQEGSVVTETPKGLSISSNCYQYAIAGSKADGSNTLYDEYSPEPGQTKGTVLGGLGYTKEVMRELITLDGLKMASTKHDKLPANKPGHYIVGMYIKNLRTKSNPNGEQDYHFIRQDSDGGWSEKPGREPHALVKRYAEPAKDGGYQTLPQYYGDDKGYQFAGYAYVPKQGIDAGIEAFLIPPILANKATGGSGCVMPNRLFRMMTKDRDDLEQSASLLQAKHIGNAIKKHGITGVAETYEACLDTFVRNLHKTRKPPELQINAQ